MNQVLITINASTNDYSAKMETEYAGKRFEKNIKNNRKASVNSNLLQATIESLKKLNRSCMLDICTNKNGEYLSGVIKNGWIKDWQQNGWKTAKGDEVKNKEQWQELSKLLSKHSVRFLED